MLFIAWFQFQLVLFAVIIAVVVFDCHTVNSKMHHCTPTNPNMYNCCYSDSSLKNTMRCVKYRERAYFFTYIDYYVMVLYTQNY